jgi:fido (protein-threonine AMPylation protein)
MAALNEFQASQMERQKLTLASNCGKETAARSKLIAEQYSKALVQALEDTAYFQPSHLCAWHATWCGENIHPDAGRFRTKSVRVGKVHFRHHETVEKDCGMACSELRRLERRFLTKLSLPEYREKKGTAAVTVAAAVLFAVVDVHGFSDGNGRLGRIALNWCLRRFGIPFVIHLFASPGQRKEYTAAITKTRRNLALVGRGNCSEADLVQAIEEAGAFAPMVELIADRLSKTILEFEKLVEEKSRVGVEEAELQAAKRVRDRERTGTCLICFDENPNIATLCCGKAVHLNCVATWFSSASSPACPACRQSFPALPSSVRAPPTDFEEDETTEFIDYDSDGIEDSAGEIEMEDGTVSDWEQSEHPDEVLMLAHSALREAARQLGYDGSASDDTMEDTTTMDDVTENETTLHSDEGFTTNENSHQVQQACFTEDCRNMAALDCSNGCCGRCCVMFGRYQCERHNG